MSETLHTHRGIEYRHLTGDDNGFGKPYSVWKFTGETSIIDVTRIDLILSSEAEIIEVIDARYAEIEEQHLTADADRPALLHSTFHGDGRYTDTYSDGSRLDREEW